MVAILKAYPNVKLKLGGYTDNTGTEEINLKLSQDRADSVRAQMIQLGADASRLEAKGYGSEHPVAPNDTDENRAKNRRIDILVIEK
ncbi:OmpA family protein [Jinshanibacter sp. LJY008]|uniref:OmpA family protein n=1 Tax=Limnobaculum eriocheiris TaxID=2897391 RepID=A0A9X1SK20_9GAMM|nr:OmpA family protein [Limnobaculum eriocheiris]